MNIESLNKDLADYKAKIGQMNKQLDDLEAQKKNILQVGTRLEGIVAYLTQKLKELVDEANAAEQARVDAARKMEQETLAAAAAEVKKVEGQIEAKVSEIGDALVSALTPAAPVEPAPAVDPAPPQS